MEKVSRNGKDNPLVHIDGIVGHEGNKLVDSRSCPLEFLGVSVDMFFADKNYDQCLEGCSLSCVYCFYSLWESLKIY